jgi:hypothetical protein
MAIVLVAALAASAAPADEPPYPMGTSSQTLEGLKCAIVMPAKFDAAQEHSLLLVLHDSGGTETGMADTFFPKAGDEYVVVAPKSTGATWSAADLDAVRRIVAGLKKRLNVGEKRVHAVGYGNGGWSLTPVAFHEALRFQSVTWIDSGFDGGKFPKHAKKEMGCLALVGGDDMNKPAAKETVKLLEDKVKSVECLVQPGIKHAWPFKLQPYLFWWLDVQEGRFKPGACAAFEWRDTPAKALEAAATPPKSGAFVYWYSSAQEADPHAKTVQNDVLRDPLVQHYGRQLQCAKVELEADFVGFTAAGGKTTPAFVVHDATGKITSVVQGPKLDARMLANALKAVSPDKTPPKD